MDDFENILKIAKVHEIKLKEMYEAFSVRFPEDADFWSKIAKEEEIHAHWISNILKLYMRGEVQSKSTTLKIQAIKSAIDYIDSIIVRCGKNEVTRLQAFGLAHDAEKGMIENKTFKSFNFMSGKYKDIGYRLEEATLKHRDLIMERLNDTKKSHTAGQGGSS